MRAEVDIFSDLKTLCTSPGYVYALAVVHLTNDAILYKEKLKPEDLLPSYPWSRLIRSELSTLFGLMIRRPVSYDFQGDEVTGSYIDQYSELMEEFHRAIDAPGKAAVLEIMKAGKDRDSVLTHGGLHREAMFYGSESAFSFQYMDLATQKYKADNTWFQQNKGFAIEDAVATEILRLLDHQGAAIERVRRELERHSASQRLVDECRALQY